MFNSEEFSKQQAYTLGSMRARTYVIVLSLFTAFGLAVSGITASLTYIIKPNWVFLIAFFAVSLIGVFIAASDSIPFKLLGYFMVAVGLGAITGPYVAMYTLASVIKIFFLTMGVTLMIGLMGAIVPFSVSHWSGFLLTGLWVLILAQFGSVFLALLGFNIQIAMTALDWVGVLLFSLYIFYDMNQAMRMEYTTENAINVAVNIYLDVMNLFIRLLALFGDKNDD